MEKNIKITCPLCKKEFTVEKELESVDANLECPYCKTEFIFGHEEKK